MIAVLGEWETRDRRDMRLDLPYLPRVEPAQPGHAVRLPAPLELAQPRHLAVVHRDHELPALDVRQRPLLAVGTKQAYAAAAEIRLERPGCVAGPGGMTPLDRPDWCTAISGSFSKTVTVASGCSWASRRAGCEAEDPRTDHADPLPGSSHRPLR